MQTLEDIQAILTNIRFLDREFRVLVKGDGFLVQLLYWEADVNTGQHARQTGRKWYVSPHATTSEVVQTALKACLTSMEHVVREHFLYKGVRVYGPHFDVEALVTLAKQGNTDARTEEKTGG